LQAPRRRDTNRRMFSKQTTIRGYKTDTSA
jgi:hypothetical protein